LSWVWQSVPYWRHWAWDRRLLQSHQHCPMSGWPCGEIPCLGHGSYCWGLWLSLLIHSATSIAAWS